MYHGMYTHAVGDQDMYYSSELLRWEGREGVNDKHQCMKIHTGHWCFLVQH